MARPEYTDDDRIRTLAMLESYRGNVSRVSRETGIPRPTIQRWRDQSAPVQRALTEQARSVIDQPEKKPKIEAIVDQWLAVEHLGLRVARKSLRAYLDDDTPLEPDQLKHVMIGNGIAADKHLDYRDGRKNAVAVDQSQNLVLPPGTTLDDLRGLRDQMRVQLNAGRSDA